MLLLSVRAAEPVSPLMGATLEQVMVKYGEPKSQITVGDRLIVFYPKERLVLRGGRVIEVEQLAAEPVRRPEPPPAASAPSNPAAPGTTANAADAPAGTAPAPAGTTGQPNAPVLVAPAPMPEPKVEIKLVRPPSATGARDPLPLAPVKPEPVVVEPVAPPVLLPEVKKGPTKAELAAQAAAQAAEVERAAEQAAKNKREKVTSSAVRRLDFAEGSALEDEATPTWRYALLVLVVVGGAGFFIWRSRQRQGELAATSVANTPVKPKMATSAAAPTAAPARPKETLFSADFLSGLDAARFETLVAAYYSKTGVVARRASGSAAGPVKIQISWKGEPRPFAGVLCLAAPSASIDVEPLRDLFEALTKENIRRGHVVTTGKFAPTARDYAAENQLTLLPGDAFLEKLNALPDSARAEIMRSVIPGAASA
ncbi:MAG: restriction endonuclease [Opitutaceae bacterium]